MLLRSTLGRNFQCRTALKAGLPSASIINVGHQIPKHRTIGSEAYEGDGRTTMTSLNEDQSGTRLLINSYRYDAKKIDAIQLLQKIYLKQKLRINKYQIKSMQKI